MAKKQPTISVIGTGFVGLTTAVLLAEAGYQVYAIDIDEERLAAIKQGRAFFYEAGINPLLKHVIENKRLIPTSSYVNCISQSDFIFSCVGTPDNPDGSSNLSYIFAAAKEALVHMKTGAVYIQKSTVPVGTGEKIEQLFNKSKKRIDYISNPEFLREGTAIEDTLNFDRVVIGSENGKSVDEVISLYKTIEKNRQAIAKRAKLKLPAGHKGEYFKTGRNSAELIKVTANAFLALKISFANSIAKLADKTGADINEIMDVVGADRRIGRAFLNAGRGYGGGCFPKDVSGLISSAADHNVDLQIMTAVSDINFTMPGYIAKKAQAELESLTGKRVAVLGLAFKAGTSDARRSPGVMLANILKRQGASVITYDPAANHEAENELRIGIDVAQTIEEAVNKTDAIFITTEWPVFLRYDLKKLAKQMKGNLFVDAMNVFNKAAVQKAGLQYIGVGR